MTVFAILAHDDPLLLNRLLHRIGPHPVAVHVDAKASMQNFTAPPDAVLVAERVNVKWGGFSVVEATEKLYREALRLARFDDEHIVLLSGRCYPARPIDSFLKFLVEMEGVQFCNAGRIFDSPANSSQLRKRWLFDSLPVGRGVTYLPRATIRRAIAELAPRRRRSQFREFDPVAGSQWTAITASCVDDLLSRAQNNALRTLFKNTLAPDETFWQTLLWNSIWQTSNYFSGSDRGDQPTSEFSNFHYIHPSLSGYRSEIDYASILQSQQFFTRKLDSRRSSSLIELLDARTDSGGQVTDSGGLGGES